MLFSATLLAVLIERSNAYYITNDIVPATPGVISVWSSWSGYGSCNRGYRYRTCTCISGNPIPCNYGTYLKEKVKCSVPAPTSRIWSAWSSWGNCVNSKRTRTANCLIPYSNHCKGVLVEETDCQVVIPQPTVIWSSWSSYGPCVGGKRKRTCNCLSPNRAVCQGVLEEYAKCVMPQPTVIWSSWSSYGPCVGGKRTRTCNCLSTDPAVCQGVLYDSVKCAVPTTVPTTVPVPTAIWSSWTSWGTCFNGKRVRTCDCVSPDPAICQGVLEERQNCATVIVPPVNTEIWSSWSTWSACNRGQRTRTCKCIANNRNICQGTLYESQNCAYVPPVVKKPNCSVLLMYSLNACLNANSLCFSWWNRPALSNAQACFRSWGYSAYQIGRFNRQFGSYLSQ